LRPYQRQGLDWMQFLRDYELGGILADDMGLGKTVQALAHILTEKRAGRLDRPCLIVCPTSLVPNWKAEAARFAPDLSVVSLQGAGRHAGFADLAGTDLALTTYPLLTRDQQALLSQEWHMVILDEAQAIKNPAAKATSVACRLRARHRLCLTGTPVENHLGEIWSQFAFLMPGLLGDSKQFGRVFRTPIEKQGDSDRRALLARRLRPFILRRTKAEVAAELPAKTLITRQIELAGDQRDLYETVRLSMHEKVRRAVGEKGLARSHIIILDALLKLRQVCCDPRLVKLTAGKQAGSSSKLVHLMEMLPQLIEEGRRILLFSQFTGMLDLIEAEVEKLNIPYVDLRGDTLDRATPVERFQTGVVPLFCLSLKAGGTGLNLTAADTVIHYDPWWNPAVEAQATDRAHRIGQDKPVFVYKLIAAGTVEEKMLELQEKKAALANGLFDPDRRTGGFDATDLEMLFDPLG
jgi:SNF2 family DNA or RNA helicase